MRLGRSLTVWSCRHHHHVLCQHRTPGLNTLNPPNCEKGVESTCVHTYNIHMQFVCVHTPTLWAHFHTPPYLVYAEGRCLQFCVGICVMLNVQVFPDFGKYSRQLLTQLPMLFVASAARCLVEYQSAVETQSSPLLSHGVPSQFFSFEHITVFSSSLKSLSVA